MSFIQELSLQLEATVQRMRELEAERDMLNELLEKAVSDGRAHVERAERAEAERERYRTEANNLERVRNADVRSAAEQFGRLFAQLQRAQRFAAGWKLAARKHRSDGQTLRRQLTYNVEALNRAIQAAKKSA